MLCYFRKRIHSGIILIYGNSSIANWFLYIIGHTRMAPKADCQMCSLIMRREWAGWLIFFIVKIWNYVENSVSPWPLDDINGMETALKKGGKRNMLKYVKTDGLLSFFLLPQPINDLRFVNVAVLSRFCSFDWISSLSLNHWIKQLNRLERILSELNRFNNRIICKTTRKIISLPPIKSVIVKKKQLIIKKLQLVAY